MISCYYYAGKGDIHGSGCYTLLKWFGVGGCGEWRGRGQSYQITPEMSCIQDDNAHRGGPGAYESWEKTKRTEGQSKERQESQADSSDAKVGDVSDPGRIASLVEGTVNLKIEDAVY